MDSELTQVERYERAVVARTHAEGSAGVQHEDRGTIWPDLTEDLDLGHVACESAGPVTMPTMIWHAVTMSSMAMCSLCACSSTMPVGSPTHGMPLALKRLPSVPPPDLRWHDLETQRADGRRRFAVGRGVLLDLVGAVHLLADEVDACAVPGRRLFARGAHRVELGVQLRLVVTAGHPLENGEVRERRCARHRR